MQMTRVDVYNITLGKVKIAKRVSSLTDQTVRRYMLPQVYELVLASLLERHPWSFATKTAKLGKTEVDGEILLPNSLYRHAWVYPHDCCKILAVGEYDESRGMLFHRRLPWEVSTGAANARAILTSHDRAGIRYLSNKVPEALWPAAFVQAMTWAMASEITRAENASDADADYRMQQASAALEAARRADVQDNGGGHRIPGDWVLSRDVSLDHAGGGAF